MRMLKLVKRLMHLWKKTDELHEKDKHDDSPHNLEVVGTKKSSGKSSKGKKIVMENLREEMKVKTQVQSLVDEYDLQSEKTNGKANRKSPICSGNQKLSKKVSTKKKDWDAILDP
jgi:hypothetical protein